MSDYVVYTARYNGVVMYVGEGKHGREAHLTSGISHCYEANKYHFAGKVVDVTIESTHNTKDCAVTRESELIKTLKPKWNKVVGGAKPQMSKHKWCENVIKGGNITCKKQQKLLHYLVKRFDIGDSYMVSLRELTAAIPELNPNLMSRVASGNYYKKLSRVIKASKINSVEYEIEWLIQ